MPTRLLRRGVLATTLLLGAGIFLWLVYQGLTWDLRSKDRGTREAYRALEVVRGDLRETVVATGALEPFARITVQSEIPGIVAAVHCDDGARVGAGQPLVELDHDRLDQLVAELRAALDLKRALARQDVVARAAADLEQVRRDHSRVMRLFAQGVAPESSVDDLKHRLALAEIATRDAKAEVDARRAAVEQAEAALRRAERDLEKSVIRAPVDGVVLDRRVDVGTAVADIQNGGTVIAVLADDRRIHLLAEVDENDVARVREGQPAQVRIDAFPGETFPGRVRRVASSGTPQGSVANFKVEIELDPDPRVRVGMSADARIELKEHHDALLVPNTAIVRTQEGPRVRVSEDGRADSFRLVAIREVYSDGFQTVVADGLHEGEKVLVRADNVP
jgi:HlyD family secretion protein